VSSVVPAYGSSSVVSFSSKLALVLSPNALKDDRLFSRRAGFSHTLIVKADWLSYTC